MFNYTVIQVYDSGLEIPVAGFCTLRDVNDFIEKEMRDTYRNERSFYTVAARNADY